MKHNVFAGLPEEHLRITQLPNEKGHNAVWDFVKSPDGRFYVSVCGENEKPLNALLYEYYPKTGEIRLIFDVSKVWIVNDKQMPPSKIHTSIDILPDGRLIMATHNTAPAPGHRQWMFEQYYEDPWEGYPGSILMFVNPDTNEVQVRGIPVPRESIYGGMLGNDPRYYYFLGYMRGHFYRLDLETNEVKDYGKVSEYSSCRLVKDAKGRFYGSSYTGEIWRYDPETDEVTDLKIHFTSPNGNKGRRQFIFAAHSPKGTLFLVDNVDSEMIELDPETLEFTRHGHIHLPEDVPVKSYGIGGLAADSDFVLYYGLKTWDHDYMPIRLMRWDILNGGKPENLGLITPFGKDSQYICEMIFDDSGLLHMVDVCGQFSPYILAVDVHKLTPPGEDAPNAKLTPYFEPDYNGVGKPAFMHIVAEDTKTLPLHRTLPWKDTAVSHMRAFGGGLFAVSGNNRVLLIESDYSSHQPLRVTTVYEGAGPLACCDWGEDSIAMLAADGTLIRVSLTSRSGILLPIDSSEVQVSRLHGWLNERLLASDTDLNVYAIHTADGRIERLKGLQLAAADAHLLVLRDGKNILLSGANDTLLLYDVDSEGLETLSVKAPAIRGRAFRAAMTGGVLLEDGTVVSGTRDGMLFTLSSDLSRKISYGRLYSTGELRNMISLGQGEAVGVYGGRNDAGHVFHYSHETGFTDLGRPRVAKDNAELSGLDTEWASIHYISCLAYDAQSGWLSVASGEEYGCIVRYNRPAFPGQ